MRNRAATVAQVQGMPAGHAEFVTYDNTIDILILNQITGG
jgi:hypothetical protein